MKPTCYNRPAFSEKVISAQFPLVYPFRMTANCGHWSEKGGNAYVRPHGDDVGGRTFEWSECDGCKWKGKTN